MESIINQGLLENADDRKAQESPPAIINDKLFKKTKKQLELVQKYSVEQQRRLRQKDAIFMLLLEKFHVLTFEYDVKRDMVFYTRMLEEQECVEKEMEDFRNFFLTSIQDDKGKRKEIMQQMTLACHKPMAGFIEYSAKITDPNAYRWYRTAYRSLADDTGKVYAIAGYTEDIHSEVLEHEQLVESVQRDQLTKLYNRATVEKMINEHLATLEEGEKGVLFLLGIDDARRAGDRFSGLAWDGYLRAVAESVRSDFRGGDVLGRSSEDSFVIFIRGRLSIDIIEKRAQHIIDLFLRVQMKEFRSVACSMGIAATGSRLMRYDMLCLQADKAMQQARKYGTNRYRMYDDDKY